MLFPLSAQPQGTRADSIARADSVARADSILLQGELARIRGERRRVDAPARSRADAPPARTPLTAPLLRLGAIVGTGTAWARDDAGVTVQQGVAAGLSGGAGWMVGGGNSLGLDLRATVGAVTIDDGGDSRSAGSTTQLDLLATLERVLSTRFAGRIGGGAAWVFGPDDVVPFRHGNSGRLQPSGEIGLLLRLTNSRPLFATLALQTTRFGNATLADPVKEPGWVSRAVIGARYAR